MQQEITVCFSISMSACNLFEQVIKLHYIKCLTLPSGFIVVLFRWFSLMNDDCIVWCFYLVVLPDTNGSSMSSKCMLSLLIYFANSHKFQEHMIQ